MATPVRTRDTHRGHPRPTALDAVRPTLVRRILDEIGKRGLNAHGLRAMTGMCIDAVHLYRLREGDVEDWSDNRLLLLGEKLGIGVSVTIH